MNDMSMTRVPIVQMSCRYVQISCKCIDVNVCRFNVALSRATGFRSLRNAKFKRGGLME